MNNSFDLHWTLVDGRGHLAAPGEAQAFVVSSLRVLQGPAGLLHPELLLDC